MLATLVAEPFDDPNWIFEIKWDGYRALLSKKAKKIDLYSRNGLDFSIRYTEVVEAAQDIMHNVLLDGEVVAVDKNGRGHFEWLQNWLKQPNGQLIYYVFDILQLNGKDLTPKPLLERKQILQDVLPRNSVIKYSDHVLAEGKKFYSAAEEHGLEGILAKKADSIYQIGRRSRDWLKIKTHKRQEVVVGGFTEPKGSRQYLGSLVLGVYEKGDFVYVGHSGGSFGGVSLKQLRKELSKRSSKQNPFKDLPDKFGKSTHWVRPELVCEVNFEEWTSEGRMRQPKIVGWRDDKKAQNVHREMAK